MTDLSTKYLGFDLKSPIIVGSSGLTNSVIAVKEHADNGAGAVVLKSLFEEQIRMESEQNIQNVGSDNLYAEAQDYISNYTKDHNLDKYLQLIEDCKKEVDIPVIASINCVSADGWPEFASKIEKAGADALELNVFILPSDFARGTDENETVYFKIVEEVQKYCTLPLSLKISYYFTNLAQMIQKLSFTGIKGLTLFNRFFSPDFDLKTKKVVAANLLSNPAELTTSLRWIGIMYDRVRCDLAASTGVHDGEGVVKQILAGANAVQVVSALYKNGNSHLVQIKNGLIKWMEDNGHKSLNEFRGKMSQSVINDPAAYERVQFMKYFSGIE
ncbi:MAG: dihydroorotate dehydrogenase-like protein [Bacteroidetes bacterium]|nr:dihydroorotate dehydrogenase-like protein [Bacteroidota bacterium]MBT5529622.1 dihydroorotate dehydrogenase-like protein [Cytophagia bacterium]MBT3424736.1 dihydroorotate dehydrogenase-like protein [Bacteroidota bacterium]MBT3935992.1 dihydroorotate dehydrogenase-like protein [Bacteroidota bacterium]MBT4338925.1 dihydroorotate dehydrogenase-like protein [Bacteroidota bacterium]